MLYVILFFAPDVLHGSETSMREAVDKHFSENWIVTIHMGHVIDLSEQVCAYERVFVCINAGGGRLSRLGVGRVGLRRGSTGPASLLLTRWFTCGCPPVGGCSGEATGRPRRPSTTF